MKRGRRRGAVAFGTLVVVAFLSSGGRPVDGESFGLKAAYAQPVAHQVAAHVQPEVEVLHWWTSGGEARAVKALKDNFELLGGKWIDSPVAGGGGDAATTVLRARILAGSPPTAAQIKGPAIRQWAEEGRLANLDMVARVEDWDHRIPAIVQNVVKVNGSYVAVPVNLHRVNWMWVNPEVFARAGVPIPRTWEEFNRAAVTLANAGIIPLAHGGQPWQDATLFETVLLSIGGPEFYRHAILELDESALRSETMIKVFDQMRILRGFVDSDFSGRDWNLASAMVMNGKAAMQIMGDWAKGEFLSADRKIGKDFACEPIPGTFAYSLNSDSFVMFRSDKPEAVAGQRLMASLILGDRFQQTFNLAKGSIPISERAPLTEFDACAQASRRDFERAQASGALVPSFSHGMALRGNITGAIVDVVTQHFNSDMSSQEAVERLVRAVHLAGL